MPRSKQNNEDVDESKLSLAELVERWHLQFAAGKITRKELFDKTDALLGGGRTNAEKEQKKTERRP